VEGKIPEEVHAQPSWMGSKEFAKVVAQNEEESKEILKDLDSLSKPVRNSIGALNPAGIILKI